MAESQRLFWAPAGKWVDEMTHEELLEVFHELAALYNQLLQQNLARWK